MLRVTLSVLIGEHRGHRLQNCLGGVVFGSDELDSLTLPPLLTAEDLRNLRITPV
jgi:hypothetical protein